MKDEEDIFLKVLPMSMTASLIALAVMGVRLLLRNAPKWVICLLWALVALRLVCPVSIESEISLVPEQVATGQIISNVADRPIEDEWVMSVPDGWKAKIPITEGVFYVYTVSNEAAITFGKRFFPVLSRIWVSGVALLLLYSVISYIRLRRSMAEATLLRGNIWQCERVDSPFILGFIRPKIYLPYAITEPDMENVIAHEQAHIRRGDHWWKPIGFLILSVHWFNPVMWVAYILLCRDIVAACDLKFGKGGCSCLFHSPPQLQRSPPPDRGMPPCLWRGWGEGKNQACYELQTTGLLVDPNIDIGLCDCCGLFSYESHALT